MSEYEYTEQRFCLFCEKITSHTCQDLNIKLKINYDKQVCDNCGNGFCGIKYPKPINNQEFRCLS